MITCKELNMIVCPHCGKKHRISESKKSAVISCECGTSFYMIATGLSARPLEKRAPVRKVGARLIKYSLN